MCFALSSFMRGGCGGGDALRLHQRGAAVLPPEEEPEHPGSDVRARADVVILDEDILHAAGAEDGGERFGVRKAVAVGDGG